MLRRAAFVLADLTAAYRNYFSALLAAVAVASGQRFGFGNAGFVEEAAAVAGSHSFTPILPAMRLQKAIFSAVVSNPRSAHHFFAYAPNSRS